MTGSTWEARADPDLQVERILDAVARVALAKGVSAVTVAAAAAEAGCSRPTVYRYFADRDSLRRAFVEREAVRLGREVVAQIGRVVDPRVRVVRAVQAALSAVRRDPHLRAWVDPGNSGSSGVIATTSPLLAELAVWVVQSEAGDIPAPELDARAAWLVRVIFSLLAQPGADEAEEQRWLERFVVPVVT